MRFNSLGLVVLLAANLASAVPYNSVKSDLPIHKVIVATRSGDSAKSFVRAYNRDGDILWTNTTDPSTPAAPGFTSLAIDPATEVLYSGTTESPEHASAFDVESGAFLTNVLNSPNVDNVEDLAFGPDGTLYIANAASVSPRVRNLNVSNPFAPAFGTFHSEAGHTITKGVAIAEDGTVFVTIGDAGGRIARFQGTSDASPGDFIDNFLTALGTPFSGYPTFYQDRLYFTLPSGIMLADVGGGAGAFTEFISAGDGGDPLVSPGQFVFHELSNTLYVASAGTDEILRYNAATGAFIDVFATLPDGSLPLGLALHIVPEPASLALLGCGLLACGWRRTRRTV